MADKTRIEWADATVNAINGCTVTSPGCTHCYAMKQAHRFDARRGLTRQSNGGMVWTGEVRLNEKALLQPLSWKRPRRIFWNAHGDTFHESVPDEWIDRMLAVCALTPQHTHMILTKRAGRMREFITDPAAPRRIARVIVDMLINKQVKYDEQTWPVISEGDIDAPSDILIRWPLLNVWLGVSVEDQTRADERIPDLIATPAVVRFLSCEPLLGPVDLGNVYPTKDVHGTYLHHAPITQLDWVIAGGESGTGARPMHPDWARSLRDQCAAAGVPFHFKQWGEWVPIDGPTVRGCFKRSWPIGERPSAPLEMLEHSGRRHAHGSIGGPTVYHAYLIAKVGKKRAGRLLDGIEHNGVPKVAP